MTFSEKISALRKQKGWSQEELAEKLMVTRQAVSKWESAQSMPDLDKLVQLSEALGVSTDYLLKDEQMQSAPAPAAAEAGGEAAARDAGRSEAVFAAAAGSDSEDDTGCGALRMVFDCAHWASRHAAQFSSWDFRRRVCTGIGLCALAGDGRGRRGAAADGKR